MFNNKRGQAAMEFLMTYGWAILAAVIAIGVLAYFGVFSPGKFVAGNSVVSSPFYANAQNVKVSSGVTLELKNNGGESYDILSVAIDPSSGADSCNENVTIGSVQAGDAFTVTTDCANLAQGETFRGDITIIYQKPSSSVNLTSTGTISDSIAA